MDNSKKIDVALAFGAGFSLAAVLGALAAFILAGYYEDRLTRLENGSESNSIVYAQPLVETFIPVVTEMPAPTWTPIPTETNTPSPTSTMTPLPTVTETATNLPEPTATATFAPSPTEIPTTLTGQLLAAIDDSNRGVTRISQAELSGDTINIAWSIDDNITADMIRSGVRQDVVRMLHVIHGTNSDYRLITFSGTYPMTDAFGNTVEDLVVYLEYELDTVNRINWADESYWQYSLQRTILDIADYSQIHPEFRESG